MILYENSSSGSRVVPWRRSDRHYYYYYYYYYCNWAVVLR